MISKMISKESSKQIKKKKIMILASSAAIAVGAGLSQTDFQPLLRPNYAQAEIAPPSLTAISPTHPNFFVDLSAKVIPSVVNISVLLRATDASPQRSPNHVFPPDMEEFFGFRFPGPGGGQAPALPFSAPSQGAMGTGVIIEVTDDKAIVLTNAHVVRNAAQVQIQFDPKITDEKREGRMIGQDRDLDIALIEIPLLATDRGKIKALSFGDSDSLKVGEFVMAVGNPFGQGHSVAHGIISAKDREAPIIGKYLQTDAPINPGNSGGPLVNLAGEIIGINNAILAQAQGIGFAIPSQSIRQILPQLRKTGKVERGYIGILLGEVSAQAASFSGGRIKAGQPFVSQLEKDGPAAQAGLQVNDILLAVRDQPVKTASDVLLSITAQPVGAKTTVRVLRDSGEKMVTITVGKRPVS